MPANREALEIFSELRRVAAADPRSARTQISTLLDTNDDRLDSVLDLAGAPGEGRLRQLIAHTAQKRNDKSRVVPHLLRWRDIETDEFARVTIASALRGVQAEAFQKNAVPNASPLPQLVETYRYVASRLCHRVRNSLSEPHECLSALEDALVEGQLSPDAAMARIKQLKEALRAVGRIVEFETDDDYFASQTIELGGWLVKMTDRFCQRDTRLQRFTITGPAQSGQAFIRGTPMHLENLFWNLWKNAQQAVNGPCEITVQTVFASEHLQLTIIDNGAGFSAADADWAFASYFPRGNNHGRGLLEVHDAVLTLQGTARVLPVTGLGYRVCLSFPKVQP